MRPKHTDHMSVGVLVEINALHGSDDDRGRPTKHNYSVDGFERRQDTLVAFKNHISVSQSGESDCREVDRIFQSFNGIECQISSTPDHRPL